MLMPAILPSIGPRWLSVCQVPRRGVQPARRHPIRSEDAEALADHNFAARLPPAVSSRRIMGIPASGGSMSMPASSIIFGMEPRVAMPMPPQAVQSMAMPRVAGRVVRKLEVILHSRSLAEL